MSRMLKDWLIALVVGVGVFVAAEWLSPDAAPGAGPAPAFTLVDVAGGTKRLADYAGKTVVLNFWGTWCPPCREEIPEFAAYARAHPDVPVLGIAVRSGEGDTLRSHAEALGVTYPVLVGTNEVVGAYGVNVFPTTFVIGPDGAIAQVFQGTIGRRTLEEAVGAVE